MLTRASHSHQSCCRLGIIETMNFVRILLKLCVRIAQPDELPYNQNAAILLSFVHAAVSWINLVKFDAFSNPSVYALFIAVAQILGVFLLLRICSKSSRFIQTLSALLGTSIIISVVSSSLASILPIPLLAGFLLFWQLYIPTFILKSALEIPVFVAFFSYIGIILFSFILTAVVFPDFITELENWLEIVNQQAEQAQQQ